jgi:hypothetical protein
MTVDLAWNNSKHLPTFTIPDEQFPNKFILVRSTARRVSTTFGQVLTKFSEFFMCWILCAYPQFSTKKFRARIV